MVGIVSIVLAVALLQGTSATSNTTGCIYSNVDAVQWFQEYIQINTTTDNNLTDAVQFWKELAAAEDLLFNVYEYVSGYPVIVIKWPGANSSQPSIWLNSHMDVVPADQDDGWTYPPFSGCMDANGDIYGRGTQDMKSVSIQYFEALRRLKSENETLLRDVYMTLMPDEEVGAESGMIPFLNSDEFTAMNVGIELDEGSSFPLPAIAIFYQDKVVWQIQVDCYGTASHGSSFPETNATATGQCRNVINRMFAFRDEQYEIANTAAPNEAGGYTSVNLNKISGGTANNVIPSHVSLVFDIRLNTSTIEEQLDAMLKEWMAEAGPNVTMTYILKNEQSPATVVNSNNPYWNAIAYAAETLGVTLMPTVPPGSTDARHVRNKGVPAFGISPMPNTPLLLHSVNEYLNVDTFLEGIKIYKQIIKNLASIPGNLTADDPSTYLYKTAI